MQQPQLEDRETEVAAIGCAIMGTVAPFGPEVFSHGIFREIWRRVKELERKGKPIDILTVVEGHPGWASELTKAAGAVPSLTHADAYFDRLRDLAARRSFVSVVTTAVREMYDSDNSIDHVLGRHYSRLAGIKHSEIQGASQLDVDRAVDDMLAAMANPQEVWGMRTGWSQFDIELGGVHVGETTLLAGTPGAGKSIFTTQICAQLAGLQFWPGQMVGEPQPGAIFSLEMTEETTVTRLACALSRTSFRQVKRGQISEEQRDAFVGALEKLRAAPIFISDDTQWTTDLLKVEISNLVRDQGIRWVLIDYAGKLKDQADGEIGRERKISQGLADISKLGVAMLVVEQLNKKEEIYGSVQKQYDADVIMKLGRQKKSPKDQRRITLEKAREADISLRFDVRIVGPEKRFDRWEESMTQDIPF